MKRLLAKLAPILIPAAIIAVAAAAALSEPDWLTKRVHQLVRVDLAERTGRQVRVGEVHGNLLGNVVIEHLAIAQPGGFEHGTMARADEVHVRFRGKAALLGEVEPLSSITFLRVVRANIKARRDETGRVDLIEMLRGKAKARLRVPIVFEDASLEYTDCRLPTRDKQPVRLRLSKVGGCVDLSRPDWIQVQGKGVSPDPAFGQLEASVRVNNRRGTVLIDAKATGIQAPLWTQRFLPGEQAQVVAGRVDARGSIASFRRKGGEWHTGYSLAGDVADGAARVKALRGEVVTFAGPIRFTGDTLSTDLLKVRGSGIVGAVAGAAFGLGGQPGVSFHVVASMLDLEHLRALKLVKLPPELASVTARLPGSGSFDVVGGWPRVAVAGTVDLPTASAEHPASPVPQWTLQGLHAYLLVDNMTPPRLEARAEVAHARALLTQDATPVVLGGINAERLRGRLSWRPDSGLQAAFSSDELTLGGLPDARLSAEADLTGSAAGFRVSGRAFGATLTARGRASWPEVGEKAVVLAGHVAGLDLAALQDLKLTGPHAAEVRERLVQFPLGRLSGDCRLEASPTTARLAFNGDLQGAVYHRKGPAAPALAGAQVEEHRDYPIPDTAVAAQLAASAQPVAPTTAAQRPRPQRWQFDSGTLFAHGRDYGGEMWVRATYPFPVPKPGHGEVTLAAYRAQIGALGVDVESALRAAAAAEPSREWAGTAYLLADLKFAPQDDARLRLLPSQVRLAALQPQLRDYQLDALTARASGDLERLEIADGRAYIGASSAQVTGLVSKVDAGKGDAALDLTVACGPQAPQGESRFQDWLHAVRSELDAHGALRASAHITGTIKAPAADGEATLLRGDFAGYKVDYAHSPLVYADEKLRLRDLHVEAYGGVADGGLTVDDVFGEQRLAGDFRAQKLWLHRLPLGLPESLDLHGALSATGIIGGLVPDPELSASVRAPELRLNGQLLRDCDGQLAYGHDLLELRNVSLKGLAGEVKAERVSYDRVARHLKAQVHAEQVRLEHALRLAAALAAGAGTSTDAPRRADFLRRAAELLHGRLTGEMTLDGTAEEQKGGQLSFAKVPGSVQFGLAALTLDGKHFPDVRGKLALRGLAVSSADVHAAENGMELAVAGLADPEADLDLALDAKNVDLAFLDRWLPARIGLKGKVGARLLARGPWQEPVLQVQDGVLVVSGPGRGAQQPDAPEQKVTFAAKLPVTTTPFGLRAKADLSAQADMQGADLGFFPALVDQLLASRRRPAAGQEPAPLLAERLSATGRVDSHLALSGTTEAPVLSGGVTVVDGRIALKGTSLALEDVQLEAAFRREEESPQAPNRLELRRFSARLGDTYISAPQAYATARSLALQDLKTAGLNIVLTAWAPVQDFGHKLRVGEMGAEIRAVREQGQTATKVAIERCGGNIGGGAVELSGTARIENYSLAALQTNPMDLSLRLTDAEPRYSPYLDGMVRTADPQGIRIRGAGNGQPAVIEGKLLLSHASIGVERPGPVAEYLLGASPNLPAPQFDLSLDVGRQVAVRLPGLTIPLAPKENAITLRGTPQRPELRVSADSRRGSLMLPGRNLTVRNGSFQYALLPSQRPTYQGRVILDSHSQLQGEMLATVADHDIVIRMSGPANSPQLEMTSKPPATQDQIFNLLFGGVPVELGADKTITEATVRALGNAAAGQIESRIIGQIGEIFIGTGLIDQLAVEGVLTGTPTIEVGKFLLKDLYVQYRKVLTPSQREGLPQEFDFKMSYRVQERYQVSFSTDEERNNRVGIEYRFDF